MLKWKWNIMKNTLHIVYHSWQQVVSIVSCVEGLWVDGTDRRLWGLLSITSAQATHESEPMAGQSTPPVICSLGLHGVGEELRNHVIPPQRNLSYHFQRAQRTKMKVITTICDEEVTLPQILRGWILSVKMKRPKAGTDESSQCWWIPRERAVMPTDQVAPSILYVQWS
jgi:hypothetical protein